MLRNRRFVHLLIVVVFALLFYVSYRLENIDNGSIEIKFEGSFKINSGYYFRINNISATDLTSIKMVINDKFTNYPHATLYRNSFLIAGTDKFISNDSTYYYTPVKGETATIYLECISANGKSMKTSRQIKYE